jgi:transcriptional regulator with XRE-family HTH domain
MGHQMEVQTAEDVLALKEQYGLTYEQFAELTGMNWNSLWNIAKGRKRMSNLSRIRINQVARELAVHPPERRERREVCAQRAPKQ